MKQMLALLIAGTFAAPIPVLAHHSFAAEFDAAKPVTVQGAVEKVEWTNPHIWVYVDAKDASGKIERWQCEGGSPNTLARQGWSRDTLKPGDQVVIEGFRAKNGSNTCNSRTVKTANGKALFAGSSLGQENP
jgi:hypothetical protein